MRVSKLAKVASIALAFGLVATTPAHAANLQGSGASFPALLIEACKAPFAAATSHTYSYASSSSGTGQSNSDKSIGDFWMSDGAYTASTKRASLIHVPLVAAPIAILHNVPNSKTLQLSAETVAKIFAGEITKWNDPAIVADNNRTVRSVVYRKDANGNARLDSKGNPIVLRNSSKSIFYTLPAKPIKVVFRSDTSGTTNNFTRWMSGNAPTVWTKPANDAFTTAFPGNINATSNIGRIVGANGSQGVATLASKTPYSITYAEKQWGTSFGLRAAYVGNASGNFTLPDSAAVSAFLGEAKQAADGIVTYDYATKVPGAYTLGIVSYMLLETSYANKEKGKAVVELAEYLLSPECSLGAASTGFIVIEGTFLAKAKQLIARANK